MWVPFTGRYTVAWSIGAECQGESWSMGSVLGAGFSVSNGNGDPPIGTETVRLVVGTLVMQTGITEYSNGGPWDTVCPWHWSITGPVTG